MNVALAVAQPQRALAGTRHALTDASGPKILRHPRSVGGEPLPQPHRHHSKADAGQHHCPRDSADGQTGGAHRGKLATARQCPQGHQRPHQVGHREDFVSAAGGLQKHVDQGRAHRITALSHVPGLVDELEDHIERHEHEQSHQGTNRDLPSDIASQPKRRHRRLPNWRHRSQIASTRTARCTHQIPSHGGVTPASYQSCAALSPLK